MGNDLVLVGGRPRGTIYAVYHFLEDVVGVHWWTPFEQSVPRKPTLSIESLDYRGKPSFGYRDIHKLYGRDEGRFAARNRINRQGSGQPIHERYGGTNDYGPPSQVHTFKGYVPPQTHFAQHPEWFALISGTRNSDQLCLTNQALRDFFLSRLEAYIAEGNSAAAAAGTTAPRVYSVSQNDSQLLCECEQCQAIATSEESESGPLIDFVNYMADGIKDTHPDIRLITLAYNQTQKPPKTIRPRDNVMVRPCDTTSNYTVPITSEQNTGFREILRGWAEISTGLRVWDYAVSYAKGHGMPAPTVHTYAADYQFYIQHRVEGVFTEYEFPIVTAMRDYKVWMMMKLLEDPYRDVGALEMQFTDGYYGAAGASVRAYLRLLEEAARTSPTYIGWEAVPNSYRFLNLDFIVRAQEMLDRAVDEDRRSSSGGEGDEAVQSRLRHVRLAVDRAAVYRARNLMTEWVEAGNEPETFPIVREGLAARYKQAWYEQIDFRLAETDRVAARAEADQEVAALLARQIYVPRPERFRDLPVGAVFQFVPEDSRNAGDIVQVVADPDAEGGCTDRLELTQLPPEDMVRYHLPMRWGVYERATGQSVGSTLIQAADIPGAGYH